MMHFYRNHTIVYAAMNPISGGDGVTIPFYGFWIWTPEEIFALPAKPSIFL
jgi:hypothetical protein